MRVLIDSNVFVSALLRSASCRGIVEALRDGAFTLITSAALVDELAAVVERPKFSERISPEDRRNLLALIREEGRLVLPKRSTVPIRDPKDRPVLECAYAAELLVTGDHDLLVLGRIGTTRVLTPGELLALLEGRG